MEKLELYHFTWVNTQIKTNTTLFFNMLEKKSRKNANLKENHPFLNR